MTKRVRMIQDYKTRKKGETWSPTDRVAKQLVAGGFASEVEEEDDATEEDDPEPQSESTDDDEEDQSPTSEDEEAEEEDGDEPSASDEGLDEDDGEEDELQPASQNANLDNVPAAELANLDRPGLAPSITPNGLTHSATAASPQRPAAAPLPARYAAHRSHIRPR